MMLLSVSILKTKMLSSLPKVMASGSWFHHFMVNRKKKMEAVTDFIFLGSRITVDGECSHEIKRHLLFGRKAMTNLDSI